MTIEDHMEVYTKQGMDKKSAMKAVAKDRSVQAGYLPISESRNKKETQGSGKISAFLLYDELM